MTAAELTAADPLSTIADAFSATAEKYDAFAEDHPHLTRMRGKVYDHVVAGRARRLADPRAQRRDGHRRGGAGARRGYRVHATDIAPGMLARARDKVERLDLADRVTIQELSFTDLDAVEGAPVRRGLLGPRGPELHAGPAARRRPRSRASLRPGGVAVLVLMPPICLWELATAVTGHFGLASRRLRRGGTRAHLEGRYFQVQYFTPERAIRALGPGWERARASRGSR